MNFGSIDFGYSKGFKYSTSLPRRLSSDTNGNYSNKNFITTKKE